MYASVIPHRVFPGVTLRLLKQKAVAMGKEKGKRTERLISTTSNSVTKYKNDGALSVRGNDDEKNLQAMTIHQLRTMAKTLGIPDRGSKRELVLALNCFLAKEKNGRISLETPENVSSEMKPIDPENIQSGRDCKKSSDGDHHQNPDIVSELPENQHLLVACKGVHRSTPSKTRATDVSDGQNSNLVAEVSRFEQKKRRQKPLSVDGGNNCLKVNLSNQVIAKKSSIVPDLVSDMKLTSGRRRSSSSLVNEEGPSIDRVGLPGNSSEPWTILAHKKPQKGWVPYNPRTMRSPPLVDGTKSVKLVSWNVNGLRALLKLESFSTFAQREGFDVLCLQETKLQEKDVEKIKQCLIDGYENSFWNCSVSKLGYSGSAIISRIKPLSVRYGLGILDHDSEGRLVTVEFDNFYLLSGYVPNSGDGLKKLSYRVTQWDPSLGNYMKELEKSKPVILTGDLNCAHEEIDIFNPAGNRRNAGFTDEERESFETNFLSRGFVDTFRRQHPGVVGYTYWGYRHRGRISNKGWRLDYFLVSESLVDKVHDSYIVPDVTGSDHCPIGLILKL